MKKSQVLAALALALALGVAAPVASTYAVYGGSVAQQEASKTAIDGAVESVENVPDYNIYHAVYNTIKTVDSDIEDANDTALASLRTALEGITVDGFADVIGSTNINSTKYDYASLTALVDSWINSQTQIVKKGEAANATTAQQEAGQKAQAIVAALEGAKDGAEAAGNFAGIYNQAVVDLMAVKKDDKDLFDTSDIVKNDQGKYTKEDYEIVEARATASPYGTYAALFKLQDKANELETSDTVYTPDYVATLVSQIEAAVAQIESGDFDTPVAPVTPDEPADEEKPTTPDTGVNTASEASATASVSILSGLASVATAAGVVIRKAFRK